MLAQPLRQGTSRPRPLFDTQEGSAIDKHQSSLPRARPSASGAEANKATPKAAAPRIDEHGTKPGETRRQANGKKNARNLGDQQDR